MPLLLLTLALAQAAASPPPPAADASPRSWRELIFVSPVGEPFRVPDGQPYPVVDWFNRADADRDGKLTETEMIADFQRFAAVVDANHDGVIDGIEVEAYETQIAPEVHSGSHMYFGSGEGGGGESAPTRGPSIDSRPRGAGKYSFINLPQPVVAMDVDLSGRITRREVNDAASYRFSLLDPQGRGYLTLAELPNTFAQGRKGQISKKPKRSN